MTAWNTVEDAVRSWVKTGASLADSQVIFGQQNGPKQPRPFVTITLGAVRPIGLDDTQELTRPDSDNAPAGQEIELRAGGPREFMVTVTASTVETVGASTARALLTKVQTALGLPSVVDAFYTGGISCFDSGRVLNTTTVLDAAHEGRALLECRFYVNDSLSEYAGYIEHVELVDVEYGNATTVVP